MRKRSDETKDNIIESAKALFLKNGYVSTTLDTIAKNAETTKRTLYGYFESKETLLKAVIEESIGVPWVFAFSIDDICTEEDLYYILYNVAKGLSEVFSSTEYVQLIRMVIAEVNKHPGIYEMLNSGITRRSLALLERVFIKADDRGIISIKNPKFRARAFVGGFLVGFYSDGLLAPHPAKLHKYSHDELMSYVANCMPILVSQIKEHAV
jgi:TetR/AcrR family transcriptional repressor of mexJK operon